MEVRKRQMPVWPSIAVVGYGRVGRVLVRAFKKRGYPIVGVVVRRPTGDPWLKRSRIKVYASVAELPDETRFLVLALRDGQIAEATREIIARKRFKRGTVVAHTAGALSSAVLEPVRLVGCLPLAWHPFQTFTGDEGPELLEGITFGIDGDPAAVRLGEKIAHDLGGIPFPVPPESRAMYHLGAVVSCNLMPALAALSQELLEEAGMDRSRSLQALGPLIEATARNIARKGLPEAITGPLKRGDAETIAKHLKVLEHHPEACKIYKALSRVLLEQIPEVKDRRGLKRLLK